MDAEAHARSCSARARVARVRWHVARSAGHACPQGCGRQANEKVASALKRLGGAKREYQKQQRQLKKGAVPAVLIAIESRADVEQRETDVDRGTD